MDGTLISMDNGPLQAIEDTKKAIADTNVNVIYEASFKYGEVFIRADILERGNQGWFLTEVKSSTECKDQHIPDVAIQTWVIKMCGVELEGEYLQFINNEFMYQGDGNFMGLFAWQDITASVSGIIEDMAGKKDLFIRMLDGDLPQIKMGSQCKKPYKCDYIDYCKQSGPKYPVSILPNGWRAAQKLQDQGIDDVRDIPNGFLTSEKQKRVREVTISGKPHLDPEATSILKKLGWPRYYLDFETIGFAVPHWKKTRPYMQVPFQWSCHIYHKNDHSDHKEFLDITGNDPRREFAESLIACCGDEGPIIVYNESFEKSRIRELAEAFPDLSDELLALNARVFDLLKIMQKHYYHPSMMGSWSIKSVLPALVPELTYSTLVGSVHDGSEAQVAYYDAISSDADLRVRQKISSSLLEYCKLDTLAMVKIADALHNYQSGH
ncbi:protein of unknown function(DUF2779) [Mariprofundus ferrinatatus]|uniref:DUF2779 domain-containing protein n=2 Tax=Mariprofundus ferrinatatus TaxID=1921087 RepID=A0A2K8L311_9PROT|nr:protein of unknown function(DUF2779) [Mariprofundus ferrinatatus]